MQNQLQTPIKNNEISLSSQWQSRISSEYVVDNSPN